MEIVIVICCTAIIMFFGYLWYVQNNLYSDEIVDRTKIYDFDNRVNGRPKWVGEQIRYKRTYKNGRVTYWTENV